MKCEICGCEISYAKNKKYCYKCALRRKRELDRIRMARKRMLGVDIEQIKFRDVRKIFIIEYDVCFNCNKPVCNKLIYDYHRGEVRCECGAVLGYLYAV